MQPGYETVPDTRGDSFAGNGSGSSATYVSSLRFTGLDHLELASIAIVDLTHLAVRIGTKSPGLEGTGIMEYSGPLFDCERIRKWQYVGA